MGTRRMTAFGIVLMSMLTLGVIGCITTTESVPETKQAKRAEGPPEDPVLRIETGMHTARIWRIAPVPQGKTLLTCSDDKTLRLWGVESGELKKILRVPIDRGKDGMLYACAFSPDGRVIAAGGWTVRNWDNSCSIYFLDAASGRMIRRIPGLPTVVFYLAFSPDGHYLAATLWGNNGLRVFDARDGSLEAKDTSYADDSYGADFDERGRLVTVSYDGHVRLYDAGFRLIAKEKAPGGKRPYSCAFSPDGERVAVGFSDSTKVNVLSGEDLSFLYAPDTSGVDNGFLNTVAWSADGRTLYAGGAYDDGSGNKPILSWSDRGRGRRSAVAAADNTIMDIRTLPGGGMVYGACDPAWGVIRSGGRVTFEGPAIADHRYMDEDFLLSRDGSAVFFGFDWKVKRPACFSVPDRALTLGRPSASLDPPLLQAPGIEVTGWKDNRQPRVNGKDLDLEKYETSRSLAVAPDGRRFVLGADWFLYAFDASGKRIWRTPVPGMAWGVNIARDRAVVVAALGDGTIRWYRLEDGEEILALFPHRDGKRWVLWTPKGYYDASVGGNDLIGWHLNRGRDRVPDFFPASRFRSVYARADVTSKVLTTLDVDEAVRLADQEAGRKAKQAAIQAMLPPVVTVLSPEDGSGFDRGEVTLRYRVRSPSGEPVTAIRFLVDGRPAKRRDRGLERVNKEVETFASRVPVPGRDCRVSVIAENRHAASEAATVRLAWRGKSESARDTFTVKPRLYLLAVGVSRYDLEHLRLKYPAKDARDVARVLARQEGALYREVETRVLSDARWGEVLDGLDWLEKQVTSKDVAAVFLAGHGFNDRDGDYYFLPADADPDKLRRTCVPYLTIKDVVRGLPGKTLFFVDTCHAGNVFGGRRRSALSSINRIVNDLSSAENGVVVFASSTGQQYSVEDDAWQNGAFSKALVEGLSGRADYTRKGSITVNELDLYLAERVKELTGGMQTPTTAKPETVPNFPVAVVR